MILKKLISIVLILFLCIPASSFAATSITRLSLEDAIKMALESDKQYKIDVNNVPILQKAYEDSKSDANEIPLRAYEYEYFYSAPPNYDAFLTQANKKYVTPLTNQLAVDEAKQKIEVTKTDVIIGVYDAFFQYAKADQDYLISKKENALRAGELANAKLKFDQGLISQDDFKSIQYEKDSADANLDIAEKTKKQALIDLNTKISRDLDNQIKKVTVKYNYKKIDTDLSKAIESALKNRLEIIKAANLVTLKEKEKQIVVEYLKDDELSQYKTAELNLKEAQYDLESKKIDIENEIKTGYNNLLNLLDTIDINRKEVSRKKIVYDALSLKYNLNMATKLDIDTARLDYDKAKNTLNSSILDYIIAKYKFDAAQSVGPEIKE